MDPSHTPRREMKLEREVIHLHTKKVGISFNLLLNVQLKCEYFYCLLYTGRNCFFKILNIASGCIFFGHV
jgi:hypothetical protein